MNFFILLTGLREYERLPMENYSAIMQSGNFDGRSEGILETWLQKVFNNAIEGQ
jgi:hypothetical protein